MKRVAVLIFISAALATSMVFLVRPTTRASPDVTITVNSTADTNTRDSVMTLREAMLMATGDLAVMDLTHGECNQVSSGSWGVWCTSPVPIGPDTAETIIFATSVFPPGSPATISLGSTLPTLDTGDDTINGSSAGVIVDGRGAGFDCFTIWSDSNAIKGLRIHNCYTAITIIGGAQYNTIGGTTEGERNVISGNDVLGVLIGGLGTNDNVVKGNYIGTDASGTAALPNGEEGVVIVGSAQNNTVQNNVISGNTDSGVHIDGGADGNVVKGNYIGTDVSGTEALPNGIGLIIKDGAQNNTIGGTTASERNVISGNGNGVEISGENTEHNTVQGNYIGTNATGTGALPNGSCGVLVFEGAQNNTIGGSAPGEGNVISGHSSYRHAGVCIIGANTVGNTVRGNYIGTDAAGTAALDNYFGVRISAAEDNVIGGSAAGEGNVISGNNVGIWIQSADHNSVKGNFIGADASRTAALANYRGVFIEEGSRSNTIGGTTANEGNVIAYNTREGVYVYSPEATRNTIRGNSIHSNGDMGIVNSNGGNTELAPPVITGVGSVLGTACANCTVDVYSDDEDEGGVYEGSTIANGAGNWSFGGSLEGPNITATATDANGNTSEFSAPAELPQPTLTPSPTPTPTSTSTATPGVTPTPAGLTRTLVWSPGWHNATWSGASTPAEVFACAAGKYAAAYRLVNGVWERYFPDRPDISNMNPLAQYDAFLILITQPVTCAMPVTAASGATRILQWNPGWQNAAWSGADETAPQDAFACAAGNYAAAYRFTDGGLERYFPDRPDISNMGPLNKYDAFLILVTALVSCPMPVVP